MVNPYKHGKFIPGNGQEIVGPEFLADYKPDRVVVMNPIYCKEIRTELDRLGVQTQLYPV